MIQLAKLRALADVVWRTALPAVAVVLERSSLLVAMQRRGILGPGIHVSTVKSTCSWLAGILAALFLSLDLYRAKARADELLHQRDALVDTFKEAFVESLEGQLGCRLPRINVRIFVPVRTRIKCPWRRNPLYFAIRNYRCLAEVGITSGLWFRVTPNPQGLVGECYHTKQIVCNNDLPDSNGEYNLTEYQRSKTNDTGFVLCAPIINKDDDVLAVVSFDTKGKLSLERRKDFTTFADGAGMCAQRLYVCLPELFKPVTVWHDSPPSDNVTRHLYP